MESKPGIFVGVACYRPYQEHTNSLAQFLQECSLKYDIECLTVWGKSLVDAQNQIADRFLKSEKKYLLMLEDDNWGFTVEMLDALIEKNFYIAGIKYYSRHYPYIAMPLPFFPYKESTANMEKEQQDYSMNLIGFPQGGWHQCGLTGFGMTLIRRECFEELDAPYFRLNEPDPEKNVRKSYATDQDFCKRLREKRILPQGCFDFCVVHRGLDDKTVESRRERADGKNSYLMRWRKSIRNRECRKAGML